MKAHLSFLKSLLRHKWFVFLACLKWGVPLRRAITHDWTKFLPLEWLPYTHAFYNPDGSRRQERNTTVEFSYAWNHHEKHNPHHWGYWIIASGDYGKTEVLPMPETYVREMLADWEGAGRAYGNGNPIEWYEKNGKKMVFHDDTRELVERLLYEQK